MVARLARWTARGTVFILSLLGLEVDLSGTTVTGPALRLEIAKSCSGSFVFLMYAAAVIPFPVLWKSRLKGLLMGLLTLLAVNLLRTSLIVLVVSRFPGALWTFHIIVGQALVIVAMMGVFLWWVKNTHGETGPSFFRNSRAIFRFLLLFGFGYVVGYGLYQLFLESRLGLFVNHLIQIHLEWILTVIHTHILGRQHASFSPVNVRLVEGCLSSPVVVLLAAMVFAWPTRWWKRLLAIFLGFIPFFLRLSPHPGGPGEPHPGFSSKRSQPWFTIFMDRSSCFYSCWGGWPITDAAGRKPCPTENTCGSRLLPPLWPSPWPLAWGG